MAGTTDIQPSSQYGPSRPLCFSFRLDAAAVIMLFIMLVSPWPSFADTPVQTPEKPPAHSPLALFQKYVSRADGNRCPMYPSCSHYSSEAFKRHGAVIGWVLTCDRLLRCGRDELRRSPVVMVDKVPHAYDPLEGNTSWWKRK